MGEQVYDRDGEHLKLLVVFNYVYAGLALLGCCFGGIYAAMGGLLGSIPEADWNKGSGPAPPPFSQAAISTVFTVVGVVVMLAALAFSALCMVSAQGIRKRRWRTLSLVTAGIQCLNLPFGTALGVCTFLVLLRPSVEATYRAGAETPSP